MVGYQGSDVFSPDRHALELIDEASSDLGSRFFIRIREKMGLAYYVGASQMQGLVPGLFAFYLGTDPQKIEPVKTALLDWQFCFRSQQCGGLIQQAFGIYKAAWLEPFQVTAEQQRATVSLINQLNRESLPMEGDSELSARIASYELAFRMQSHAPEVVNISSETAATRKLYGLDQKHTSEFGLRCLFARRMIERGVRFVQLYCGDTNGWDGHSDVDGNHTKLCAASDLPVAGLLKDLKSRGLLDSTLVIWGGEFGRMPMSEGSDGRDHNPHGFSIWLAGGGVKGGQVIGATDAVGLRAVDERTHTHDLHATILHLLGFDHKKLTYRYNGRDFRLTDVYGNVAKGLIA